MTPNCWRVCRVRRLADSTFKSALTNLPAPSSRAPIRFVTKSRRSEINDALVPKVLAVDLRVLNALSKSFIAPLILASVVQLPAAAMMERPEASDTIPETVKFEAPSSLKVTDRFCAPVFIRFVPAKDVSLARLSICKRRSLN